MELGKRCRKCGEIKPVSQFAEMHIVGGRLSDYCGDCEVFTIYALVDPRDSRIHYVGCTQDPQIRYTAHLSQARYAPQMNKRKAAWINDLRRRGLRPVFVIIEEVNLWQHVEREMFWITTLAQSGAPLTNAKPGYPVRYYAS